MAVLNFDDLSNRVVLCAIALSFLLIAYLDFVTGIEVRFFPFYFLPMFLATRRFGYTGALISSIVATFTWVGVQYLSHLHYSNPWIWPVNFFTQGLAFVGGSLLFARLSLSLKEAQQLSRTDQLTGLANRRAFYELSDGVLQLCKRNRKPVTLVFLDLDNFKELNDSQGHAQGDEFLRRAGITLRESLRASDIAARFGGDEFAVLLPETGRDEAILAMEKVRLKLASAAESMNCEVTASIGGVCYGRAPSTLEQMTGQADQLMYKVKVSTKDRVHIVAQEQLNREVYLDGFK